MLTENKRKMVDELVVGWTKEELIWLHGYLSGIVAHQEGGGEIKPANEQARPLTITYGTETGSAKKLASAFAAQAKKKGIQVKLVGLEEYRLSDLPQERYFLTVVSTHGDGEPPSGAKKFY